MSPDPRLMILRLQLYGAAQKLTGVTAEEFWKLLEEVQSTRLDGPDPHAQKERIAELETALFQHHRASSSPLTWLTTFCGRCQHYVKRDGSLGLYLHNRAALAKKGGA